MDFSNITWVFLVILISRHSLTQEYDPELTVLVSSCCSIFQRKRNIYTWYGFIFSRISAIEIIVIRTTFLSPIEDIDSLKLNLKVCFISYFFAKFWELEICQIGHALDKFFALSEDFINHPENFTQFAYVRQTIPYRENSPN